MENIEIKHQVADWNGLVELLRSLPDVRFVFRRAQIDHYFDVPEGRCKLRIEAKSQPQLIRYQRADVAAARVSDFTLEPVDDPQTIIDDMCRKFGLLVTVRKTRHLYMYRNVRIHLDEVANLGYYSELESMIKDGYDHQSAQQSFDQALDWITPYLGKVQSVSYQNLLMERRQSPAED